MAWIAWVGIWCLSASPGEELPSQGRYDEQLVKVPLQFGPGLLFERFRQHSLTATEYEATLGWIADLAHPQYAVREKALAHLQAGRPGTAAVLFKFADDPVLERRHRVQRCLRKEFGHWPANQAEAAVRLCRRYPHLETLHLLVEFFPTAGEENVELEVLSVLHELLSRIEHGPEHLAGLLPGVPADCRPKLAGLLQKSWRETSPTLRTLEGTRLFLSALQHQKKSEYHHLAELPFVVGTQVLFRKAEPVRDYLDQVSKNLHPFDRVTYQFLEVRRGEDYFSPATLPAESAWTESARSQVRAVTLRVRFQEKEEETGVILVRLEGDRVRIVGIGPGRKE